MTTRLFRSTDVGAPQMGTSGGGDLITVLRACLVDGYGSRTPQGWTMPFSDLPNNKACFLGVSGTGDYLRVDDNHGYQWSEVAGYGTMTDVDTGTGKYPESDGLSIPVLDLFKIYKRALTSSVYDEWFLVSDDEWFYYIGVDTTQSYPCCGFFGQYECVSSTFSSPYCLGGVSEPATGSSYNYYCWYGILGQYNMWQRRSEWDDIDRNHEIIRDFEVVNHRMPNPLDGKLYFEKCRIRDSSDQPYVFWGHMPNYYRLMVTDDADFPIREVYTIGVDKYIIVSRTSDVVALKYDVDAG